MNFNKVIFSNNLIQEYKHDLMLNSKSMLDKYKNLNSPTETSVTANYIGLTKCYQILSNIKFLKDISTEDFAKVQSNVSDIISCISGNLNIISENLKTRKYKKDIELLSSKLKANKLYNTIYPIGSKIALATVFNYNKKFMVFTTCYGDNLITKYINIVDSDIIPGSYDLGQQVDDLNSFILNQNNEDYGKTLDKLIKNSEVFDTFIKSSLNSGINAKKAIEIFKKYYGNKLNNILSFNGSLLLKFNKNAESDISNISKSLKLNNNDTYKFLATLKE